MKKRVIAVFTGNRAEYGLQYPILRAIELHPWLDYRLIVSGAHLDADFGRTLDEIRSDGFQIHREVKIKMDAKSLLATSQAIGSGIVEISKALSELAPDMALVYADRFEGFAAVVAATQMGIPTAHVEGGDLTEGGALDDSVRHAMTKLSHLHFTTNQQASNRLLGMGEESWRVHTVGFPAIDLISQKSYAAAAELVSRLRLNLSAPIVLFTQHSITTEFDKSESQVKASLQALEVLAGEGAQVVLTYPNNDAGGRQIIDQIEMMRKKNICGVQIHQSLGRHLYHGLLALAENPEVRIACVGNSSSGIKETPAFHCPTVNIGSRQSGRLRALNVIDVDYVFEEILSAVRTCLFDNGFRQACREAFNPYGLGNAGVKIAEVLFSVPLDQTLIRKKMTLAGVARRGWFK